MDNATTLRFDSDVNSVKNSYKPWRRRGSAIGKATVDEKTVNLADEEAALGTHESDFKHKQVFHGWLLAWLAYQSTGVIYGDIGTSPLYVYSSTFSGDPLYDDLLGALSLIIWSLTIIVTIKYVLIVLHADNGGEGGTFAVYSLLARYSNISTPDPQSKLSMKMERYTTDDMNPANREIRGWLEHSVVWRYLLRFCAVFGVALIMADGVLTPAQSVLGAIQGIQVVQPDISYKTIIGISCAILVVLFVAQPLGITKLGSAFAPVVIVWLLFNFCSGVYNLAVHDYTVLKAFSPYFAGQFFVRNGTEGWKMLGGILLAFTGVETLFADLGAFSMRAIQLSWLCFAYPCLLMAYIGQAAYISDIPSAWSNPFFETVPPGSFYFSLVLSILAAIVASQAIITGTFQLISQITHAAYFPNIRMIYTSGKFHGQVYVPWANWILMAGTLIVTGVYNNTTSLGHAYGVCVILVTSLTTCMIALVALIVWRFNPILVFLVWLPFITFDGLYLTSALTKFPSGAWSTLMIAIVLASFFILWRWGKGNQWRAEREQSTSLHKLITPDTSPDSTPSATATALDPSGSTQTFPRLRLINPLSPQYHYLSPIAGLGIFFDKAAEPVPPVFANFLKKFEAIPDVCIFLHLRALSFPSVPEEDRYTVAPAAVGILPHAYRVVIRHGYNDEIYSPHLGDLCYERVRAAIISRAAARLGRVGAEGTGDFVDGEEVRGPAYVSAETAALVSEDAGTAARLAALDRAHAQQTVYIVGKEEMRILPVPAGATLWRRFSHAVRFVFMSSFLWIRENSRARVSSMRIPVDKLVEIGFVMEV